MCLCVYESVCVHQGGQGAASSVRISDVRYPHDKHSQDRLISRRYKRVLNVNISIPNLKNVPKLTMYRQINNRPVCLSASHLHTNVQDGDCKLSGISISCLQGAK
jgi:hypothetical protein